MFLSDVTRYSVQIKIGRERVARTTLSSPPIKQQCVSTWDRFRSAPAVTGSVGNHAPAESVQPRWSIQPSLASFTASLIGAECHLASLPDDITHVSRSHLLPHTSSSSTLCLPGVPPIRGRTRDLVHLWLIEVAIEPKSRGIEEYILYIVHPLLMQP